jgi:hypothetical protein
MSKQSITWTLLLCLSTATAAEPNLSGTWQRDDSVVPLEAQRLRIAYIVIDQQGRKVVFKESQSSQSLAAKTYGLDLECSIDGATPCKVHAGANRPEHVYTAKWDGADLVVMFKNGQQESRTMRKYALSPDGQSLLLKQIDVSVPTPPYVYRKR